MSEHNPVPARSFLPRWAKRVLGLLGAVVLLLAVVVGIVLNPFSAGNRHRHLISRLSEQVMTALEPLNALSNRTPEMTLDERTRYEVLRAVNTAIWNVLYSPRKCSPEKLRALVDRLNATGAAELRTGEGCLRLVAELEDICPDTHDYTWFVQLRELQAEGSVARLKEPPK